MSTSIIYSPISSSSQIFDWVVQTNLFLKIFPSLNMVIHKNSLAKSLWHGILSSLFHIKCSRCLYKCYHDESLGRLKTKNRYDTTDVLQNPQIFWRFFFIKSNKCVPTLWLSLSVCLPLRSKVQYFTILKLLLLVTLWAKYVAIGLKNILFYIWLTCKIILAIKK